jgi:hypothetical protein
MKNGRFCTVLHVEQVRKLFIFPLVSDVKGHLRGVLRDNCNRRDIEIGGAVRPEQDDVLLDAFSINRRIHGGKYSRRKYPPKYPPKYPWKYPRKHLLLFLQTGPRIIRMTLVVV